MSSIIVNFSDIDIKSVDMVARNLIESTAKNESQHGPRIKHVCRRAEVALGGKPATFPLDLEIKPFEGVSSDHISGLKREISNGTFEYDVLIDFS